MRPSRFRIESATKVVAEHNAWHKCVEEYLKLRAKGHYKRLKITHLINAVEKTYALHPDFYHERP